MSVCHRWRSLTSKASSDSDEDGVLVQSRDWNRWGIGVSISLFGSWSLCRLIELRGEGVLRDSRDWSRMK